MAPEDLAAQVRTAALCAKGASRAMRSATTRQKDAALLAMAKTIREKTKALVADNELDVADARTAGLSAAMIDRLALTPARLDALARSVEEIVALADPIGRVDGLVRRPSGIVVGRMRVPLGVVAMIYESRPNVTIDAAALTIKSGNAVVLRGGKEARRTNAALAEIAREALFFVGLPRDAVVVSPSYEREATRALLGLVGIVDVAVPRGGEGLVAFVAEHARVPVIAHYKGVCHLYVDEDADVAQAIALVVDGKARRPGVCNALETLLVHRAIAQAVLPALDAVLDREGVEVRAGVEAKSWMPHSIEAKDDDFGREFLAKILAVRVVDSFDAALDHVARFGSGHTEAICTPSYDRAQRWLREVDASCVLVNASTRFNDGGELGLGAELGIATSKLHAYGPMGLEELTTRKWIVYGEGEVRG